MKYKVQDLIDHDYKQISVKVARELCAQIRADYGFVRRPERLLTPPKANQKFDKTRAVIFGLTLAAHRDSLLINNCTNSTRICRAGCVGYNGKGAYPSVQRARQWRTALWCQEPDAFQTLLFHELRLIDRTFGKDARQRMNTLSDQPWEQIMPELFEEFPRMRFYDYTKHPDRCTHDTNKAAENYRLCFSHSERDNLHDLIARAAQGVTQAVVFDTKKHEALPTEFHGIPVIDGDVDDDRYLDPYGVIVGLRAKGKMRTNGGRMVMAVR